MELVSLDSNAQRSIVNFSTELSTEEIAIILLMLSETAEEIKFLREVFLSRQYIDMLFRNIDNKVIE